MQLEVMWAPVGKPGTEHLRLISGDSEYLADSIIVGVLDHTAISLRYRLELDSGFATRRVHIDRFSAVPGGDEFDLEVDSQGNWNLNGMLRADLQGCIDIDINASPFSNTLPIRRLNLQPGQAAEIAVAWVQIPEQTVVRSRQRYTCLDAGTPVAHYRYEGLDSGYTTDLPIDRDGLVIDYPDIWNRVWLEVDRD